VSGASLALEGDHASLSLSFSREERAIAVAIMQSGG